MWADSRAGAARPGLPAWGWPRVLAHLPLAPGPPRPRAAAPPAPGGGADEGRVLGTFAMYSATVKAPAAADMRLADLATRIAGIAIERQKTEERIRHMAHHDELTGLPNRALLRDRLAQALLRAERQERSVTVAFIDLDNFKLINDSLGHTAGDELLPAVSTRLLHCVRATDTVVRLGDAPLSIRNLKFLQYLIQSRRFRRARIALASGLKQVKVKSLLVPRIERLAAEMGRERMGAADDLALFHNDSPGAQPSRLYSRGQAGRPGPYDEEINPGVCSR